MNDKTSDSLAISEWLFACGTKVAESLDRKSGLDAVPLNGLFFYVQVEMRSVASVIDHCVNVRCTFLPRVGTHANKRKAMLDRMCLLISGLAHKTAGRMCLNSLFGIARGSCMGAERI